MLLVLAGIILYSLLYLKEPTLSSQITTAMLATVLIMVLLIMRDLQEFRLGGEFLGIESGEEMFEVLGKPRYYSEWQLTDGSVTLPTNLGVYRLGRRRSDDDELDIVEVGGGQG